MTISELDRLVTNTELTPVSKSILRKVRKIILSDTYVDPKVGKSTWSVSVDVDGEQPKTLTFSFKRNKDA